MKFWDTSALLPLCLQESQTSVLRKLVDQDGEIVAWWGALIEGYSALARLRREEELTMEQESHARQLLTRLASFWAEVRPSNLVRDQAARALLIHPLRAADALQLAAALIWSGNQTTDQEFVCLDHRLRDAAYQEGFKVVP